MDLPRAVLFDFSDTLFFIETAREAVLAALGEQLLGLVPALERFSAINGSGTPVELPTELTQVWARRDLSHADHRAAYSGLGVAAGLTPEQATRLYDRGVRPEAWHPYADTIDVLARLRSAGVPVALVSNIGWDPRPVLRRYGAADLIDSLVLSDEVGVMKPEPAIFQRACTDLQVEPQSALMVGDNPDNDGGATAIGCRFVLVPGSRTRPADTLLRAVGFADL